MEAKDFTSYLIYINIYMMVLILSYFLFFNTEYRREKVNLVIVKLQHYTIIVVILQQNNVGKILENSPPHLIEECEALKPADKGGECSI